MKQKVIIIYDFGGQSAHLISRRIQSLGFDTKIVNPKHKLDGNMAGIILSGGARSVYGVNAPKFNLEILKSGIPILGICYGHQLIAHFLGGRVEKGKVGEYGRTRLAVAKNNLLFDGLKNSINVWMNHRDLVVKPPKGFKIIGKTERNGIAAFENSKLSIFSVQFHPEVTHTDQGNKIIKNFIAQIESPKRSQRLIISDYVNQARLAIGDKKAVIGLSGGVDSAVAAILVSRAIKKRLLAVYVDTGFMRFGETEQIKRIFRRFPFKLKVVKVSNIYFRKLKGVRDPELKRKIIGKTFIEIFDKEAKKFGASFLVQGTIYSDRIESGSTKYSSKIKSHHNVGGLPKKMKLKVFEPLKDLYKDEVRILSKQLHLPSEITHRLAFPGPGLAIRVLGELTLEKVDIVRRASRIVEQELDSAGILKRLWMAFPVLLPVKSVGIQGDERSYKYPIVLRMIESKDVITANFAKIPYDVLERISTRITNEIQEVNRVVYDISHKPPATMEWE